MIKLENCDQNAANLLLKIRRTQERVRSACCNEDNLTLFCRNTIIGLVSAGSPDPTQEDKDESNPTSCSPDHNPTVFARVSEVKTWIKEMTQGADVFDSKCQKI